MPKAPTSYELLELVSALNQYFCVTNCQLDGVAASLISIDPYIYLLQG